MPSSHEPPTGGKIPIRPALRLVHPAKLKEPRPKERRHESRVFSPEEQRLLRASLNTARGLFGSWSCLADAMRVPVKTVERAVGGRYPVSAALAVRLSRALGVPLSALITPGLRIVPFPKICPTCGAQQQQQRAS
jgi:hypothetical protein